MPSPEDAATLQAHIMGVDKAATMAEDRWGVGRLPMLVDGDMRARFMRQGARFREALDEAYASSMLTADQLQAVQKAAEGMERAWAALDKAATESGCTPVDPDIWEAVLEDGSIACIVRTTADASKVLRDGRALNVWTLDEVARAIDHLPEIVRQAKETWPGATVVEKRQRSRGVMDDPVPF
jgi:hypothetical protein